MNCMEMEKKIDSISSVGKGAAFDLIEACAKWEEMPDFVDRCQREGRSAEHWIDPKIDWLCHPWAILKEMRNHFPKRSDWETLSFADLYARTVRELERRQRNVPQRKPTTIENSLRAKIKEQEELIGQLRRERLADRQKIASLQKENTALKGRLKAIERAMQPAARYRQKA